MFRKKQHGSLSIEVVTLYCGTPLGLGHDFFVYVSLSVGCYIIK